MNDEAKEKNQKQLGIDYVVTLDELKQFDVNSVLEDVKSVDCRSIKCHLINLRCQTPAEKSNALEILITLVGICLVPDDPDNPFRPMWKQPDGKRAPVPSDFKKEQIDIISEFVRTVDNLGLRARLADVSWFVQRNRKDMAEIAIDAYCESVEKVRKGEAVFLDGTSFGVGDSFCDKYAWGINARDTMARVARISYATKWELEAAQRFKLLLKDLIETAYEKENGDGFHLMGMIVFKFKESILPIDWLAKSAKELAEKPNIHPDVKADLFHLAAAGYTRSPSANKEKIEECNLAAAECSVEKADFARSKMEEAVYLETAIQLLIRCPRTKDRRRELTERLKKIQLHIIEEMKIFSSEINLEQIIKKSTDSIQGLPWPDAFHSLVERYIPPKPDEINEVVFECVRTSPLQMIIPYEMYNAHRNVVFRAETECGHLQRLASWFRTMYRQGLVLGEIEPRRKVIASEHKVSIRMLSEILQDKPFITDDYESIYARAIFHFLHGDNIEATSLLVPQLENSLRHILASEGHDTMVVDKRGIQTEASLPILLNPKEKWRRLLEEIIPARYILEIDFLFNFAGGPSIRNKIAHGSMSNREFQDYNCIYAVWLIIHLAIFFPGQLSK